MNGGTLLKTAALLFLLAGAGAATRFLPGRIVAPLETAAPAQFTDVTKRAGIAFRHWSGARGKKYMPETVGSGVAFLDYDNDGYLDLLYVNSTDWPGPQAESRYPALYRNNGDGTFTDVTRKAGLWRNVYGMGAAVGDYDNDGWPDIYLTCIGPNILFRNNGDGTFTDVTAKAGVAGMPVQPGGIRWKWSSSAAWCDYDRDGKLDLFVCNYVKWTPQTDIFCASRGGKKAYCAPHNFEGLPCTLYRGRGDGTFEDVSEATGIANYVGKAFGVVPADFNGDGWIDFAVTNDTTPNFLFLSEEGGKRFREVGVMAGIAFSDEGKAKAGMGIDAADFQNNGRLGLLTGNFARECLSLFVNDGKAQFRDTAYPAGVAAPSLLFLTFGLFFFDYDLDGRQDIFTANGHIDDYVNDQDTEITYLQRPLLYRNRGEQFEEVGANSGPAMQTRLVGRGCAWGDFDLDGDPDIAIVSNHGPGYLWRNDRPASSSWIGLKLRGTRSNRDGWGAVIRVAGGGQTQTRHHFHGGSFLSTNQPWPLFGLNGAAKAERIEIAWPSGAQTRLENLESGCYYEVTEGGEAVAVRPGRPSR